LAQMFNKEAPDSKIITEILSSFDATEWVMYRFGLFFLLLPNSSLANNTAFLADFNTHNGSLLRLADKEDLARYFNDNNKKEFESFKAIAHNEKISLAKNFLTLFKNLFPRSAEVSWVIYLLGHGTYGQVIAELSINASPGKKSEFQQLLDILEKRIHTKLFVYQSCFAAGFNAEKVYREQMAM
jgi:hypothetical protein